MQIYDLIPEHCDEVNTLCFDNINLTKETVKRDG